MAEKNLLAPLEELLRAFYDAHPDYTPQPGSWTGDTPLGEADWLSCRDVREALWWARQCGMFTPEDAMRIETRLREIEHQMQADPPEED
jgi:hypothetical protein